MIIKCTKQELRKMVIACSEGNCTACAMNDICNGEPNKDMEPGEYIAGIAVITDAYAACKACVPAAEEADNG